DWSRSCSAEPDRNKTRPGYHLPQGDQTALKDYYSQPRPGQEDLSPQARGRDLLVQLNCLACHQREGIDRTAQIPLPSGDGGGRSPPGEGLQRSAVALQDKLLAVA